MRRQLQALCSFGKIERIGETAALGARIAWSVRFLRLHSGEPRACVPMGLFFCPNSVKLLYNFASGCRFHAGVRRQPVRARRIFRNAASFANAHGIGRFPPRACVLYLRSLSDAGRAAAFRHFRRRVFNPSRRQFPAVRAARIPRPSAPRRRRCALLFRPLPTSSRA